MAVRTRLQTTKRRQSNVVSGDPTEDSFVAAGEPKRDGEEEKEEGRVGGISWVGRNSGECREEGVVGERNAGMVIDKRGGDGREEIKRREKIKRIWSQGEKKDWVLEENRNV